MFNPFEKIAEKIGIVVQGGNVNIGEIRVEGIQQAVRPKSENFLINQVKVEVEGKLSQSLHHQILINLEKSFEPNLVSRFWDNESSIGITKGELLPAGTTSLDVFERSDINGKLLVLGAPGSGKTTTLIELAKILLEKACLNLDHPIPIILNITSWVDNEQLIFEWLIIELKSKYAVPTKIANHLIEQNRLIYFFDGLDELDSDRQELFVKRINLFLKEDFQLQYLVISSRQREYENLQNRLRLNGAIVCEPLTIEQLEEYFIKVGKSDLIKTINSNTNLLNLLKVPLFLNIFVVIYNNLSDEKLKKLQTTEAYKQYLLDNFIHESFVKLDCYFKSKIGITSNLGYRRWLSWISGSLENKAQTEFIIDELQPYLLGSKKKILIYNLLVDGLTGTILFIACFGISRTLYSLGLSFFVYLVSLISPINTTTVSRIFRSQVYVYTLFSFGYSIIFFLLTNDFSFFSINRILLLISFFVSLIIGLGGFSSNSSIEMVESLKISLKRSFKELFFSGLGGFVSTIWLFFILPFGKLHLAIESLLLISIIFLGNSSLFLFTYGIIGRLFAPVENLGMKPSYGFFQSLKSARTAFLFFGLIVSLMGFGIASPLIIGTVSCPAITPEEFQSFNIKNLSLLYDLHDFHLDHSCNKQLVRIISTTAKYVPIVSFSIFGIYFGFLFGGLASLQHLILRLFLSFDNRIPLDLLSFLEACKKSLLLQCTGGRYRFIHKTVQDYFSAVPSRNSKIVNK